MQGRLHREGGERARWTRPAALYLRRTHGVTVSSGYSAGFGRVGVVGMWAVGWMGAHERTRARGEGGGAIARSSPGGGPKVAAGDDRRAHTCDSRREGRVGSPPGGEVRRRSQPAGILPVARCSEAPSGAPEPHGRWPSPIRREPAHRRRVELTSWAAIAPQHVRGEPLIAWKFGRFSEIGVIRKSGLELE